MTKDDKINAAYHERIMGKCVKHEWVESDPDNRKKNITRCKKYSAKFSYFQIRPKAYVPNYLDDPAVVLGELIEIVKGHYDIYMSPSGEFCIGKIIKTGSWPFVAKRFAGDINPNHAILLARLKMEGVEV